MIDCGDAVPISVKSIEIFHLEWDTSHQDMLVVDMRILKAVWALVLPTIVLAASDCQLSLNS